MAEGLTFGMNIKAHIKKTRPAEVQRALDTAIDYGARLVRLKARDLVPVKTGKLKKSLNIRNIPKGKGIGTDVDYAAHVEFGTLPHRITAKNKKVLHFIKDGKDIFVTHVHHPGTSEQQYLRPAMDTSAKKISKFLMKKVRQALS